MQQTQSKQEVALAELKGLTQWVCWEYEQKPGKNKPYKVPITPSPWRYAKPNDPSTWRSYEDAIEVASEDEHGGYRVGFMFSDADPYCGVDLDNCINLDTGELSEWAAEIVEKLGSYTEVSPSGTGLKIWIKATKPGNGCRTGNIEIYDSGRFFTFTGRAVGENAIEDRQDQLDELYHKLFPTSPNQEGYVQSDGFSGDDQQLLLKMRNSGNWRLFRKLYDEGNWSGFKSQSEADLALCGILAYWTGRDEERMVKLFLGSHLARGLDRKSDKASYLERTVLKAIKNCNNVYDPNYKNVAKATVQEMLISCIEYALADPWKGRSGPTDRDVYRGMINTGWLYGKVRKDGVSVAVSLRDLAPACGIGRRATIIEALKRLQSRGLIEKLEDGGARKAATYLIKLTQTRTINTCVNRYGTLMSQEDSNIRTLRSTMKIRNPSPAIATLGKRNGQILDYVYSRGAVVTLEEIARHLKARKDNIKKRNIPLLLDSGLLEEKENGYVTPQDVEDRLKQYLERSGTNEAEKLQRERIAREREAYERNIA